MRNRRFWGSSNSPLLLAVFALVLLLGFGTTTAFAVDSSSQNYQITEWDFNTGAGMDSCSGSYCAQSTIGMQGGGPYSDPEFGTVETDEPLLEVIVVPGESDLGTLTTERTATKTSTVKVRSNYEAGYTLQMIGDPPKFEGHTLASPSTPTASEMGKEQFAINLTANTSPAVGTLPRQVQTNEGDQTVYGQPMADYATPNLFKYVSGDPIAESLVHIGRTDYTITMIINVSNQTPAGHYSGDFAMYILPQL